MSHQDSLHGTANAEHLQEALDALVPKDALEGVEFQKDSRWKPLSLIFAALMWSWSSEGTLTDRFAQALKILLRMDPGDPPPGKSYQGFMKRLLHWSKPLVERLKAEFRRRMRKDLAAYLLVAGWLLFAADGSRIETPRTKSNQERFAASKKKRQGKGRTRRREKQVQAQRRRRRQKQAQADRAKKAETPQLWVTVLYVVTLGLPWDWRRGPSNSSEREHLGEMVRDLPENALVTMDAGFVGYEFWAGLKGQVTFVARVGGNVKLLTHLGSVRQQGGLVFVWPDQARRKEQPPLVLRLECFWDGRERVYLVSNELDFKRLSTQDLRAIYKARWGVEVFYRDFKQTFERGKLLSKTADHAELELDWSLMGLWAMNLYASLEHAAAGKPPTCRSVANVLRAFRRPMNEHKSAPDAGEDLWSLLAKAVKDTYQRKSSKASQNYPRKKAKHAISAPEIVRASAEQVRAARRLARLHRMDADLPGLTA